MVVAVVVAVHAVQVVQGAPELHVPLVHPVHSDDGHPPGPAPPHQEVHGPEVHEESTPLPKGPLLKAPLLKGPPPLFQGPPLHVVDNADPVKEASGAWVSVEPAEAHKAAIFW